MDPVGPLPSTVGRYAIRREVGRGGMAIVFEAEDVELGRRVALKVLREGDSPAQTVARLHREASIAARLKHPNIVAVHEVGTAPDGVHFIAMDYVEGRTLADVFDARRLSRHELLRILEEVARAVGYAHEQGVVHRDIKPGNVIVDSAGRAMLTDFGLARAADITAALTRSQAVMGTPQYMAPEQVEGRSREVDARTDVYALGALLYEALVGRPAFSATTPAELFRRILQEEPSRPTRSGSHVDVDLEVICLKAMEKERARRYANGTDFAEDLARFRRGEPIAARPASFIYRAGKALRRKRVIVAAAAGAVLLATAGSWIVDALRRSSRVASLLAEAERLESERAVGKAHETYRAVVALRPDDARARAAFDRLDAAIREADLLVERGRGQVEAAAHQFYRQTIEPAAVRRHLATAREHLEKAEALRPDRAAAAYHLGRTWELEGWDEKADACWRRAIAIDASYGPAYAGIGRILSVRMFLTTTGFSHEQERRRPEAIRLGNEAIRFLRAAMERGCDSEIDRAVTEALMAYTLDEHQKVCDIAEGALARLSGDGTEWFDWLAGLSTSGEARVKCFERALAKRPQFPLALLTRAIEMDLLGNRDQSLHDYTCATLINPRLIQAWLNRGALRKKMGDLDGAIEDQTRVIELDPQFPWGWLNRGDARTLKKDFDGALADLNRALELRPDSPAAHFNRGNLHTARGDAASAIADYGTAIRLNPKDAPALVNRGFLRLAAGAASEALADFDAAVEAQPTLAAAWAHRSRAKMALGNADGAMADVTRAIELDPSDPTPWLNRANWKLGRGDPDGALVDYTECLRRDERFALAWLNRALARQMRGDAEGGIADATRAIELDAASAPAWHTRAMLRDALGRTDEAVADFGAALRADPTYGDSYIGRGLIRKRNGDLAGAAADFRDALKRAPADWRNRALAEQHLREVEP
jgi:serine/threonine-protein kinase